MYAGMASVFAVLFVEMFTSALSAISDIVYLCSQCTKNSVCATSFIVWNTIEIVVDCCCQIALVHLISDIGRYVSSLLLRSAIAPLYTRPMERLALPEATQPYTTQGNANDDGNTDTPPSTREAREEAMAKALSDFTETVQPKGSIPFILLVVLVKAMVLAMYKQHLDVEDWNKSANNEQSASSWSRTTIGAWRLIYREKRKSMISAQALAYAKQQQAVKTS
ncbi:unnamed protein product, partial [Ixodes hexagonus]